MSEKIVQFEKKVERFPNEREVMKQVEQLANGATYEHVRQPEYDETGLVKMDIKTTDADGDQLDISYTRDIPAGDQLVSRIHETLYCNGVPVATGRQYQYVNGNWKEQT